MTKTNTNEIEQNLEIETISIHDITPAYYNPRIMKAEDMEKLKRGLKEFGLVDPLIINLKNNNTLIGGHQRHKAMLEILREQGKDDQELILLKRGDVGLVFDTAFLNLKDTNHEKALNIALNKITGEWDSQKLNYLLYELEMTHIDMDLTGFHSLRLEPLELQLQINKEEEKPKKRKQKEIPTLLPTEKYTPKLKSLHYEITGEEPSLNECYDASKTEELIKEIKKAKITKEQKEFLIKAAERHTVFSFDKIAEYYAHQDKTMQELMEKSALVIIDFDNALENGYVKVSKEMNKLVGGLDV